ncbi:phage shock protein operon transcriptional activator [Gallaecimonas kandeliae]|uniref:phage shock protein operon transcriptional activator n=1 Tax=Gallaecimonas kandeliae TaxID=3029055 RepID=UPI002647ABD7|nr:phage shock protein operon transcriptional activator [Gallaecimonas kandeliae]WKE64128.1 phage shock protein operon transcriptional activator [Gallaecimonas kandeliae]
MAPRQHDNLLGQANSFLEVMDQVSRVAPLNKPVLIIGERGTGKELIAERLHFLSSRWDQSYLKLNCAALNENLLESELFGYDQGAFTGAAKRHSGRFERADGGTLFLDELANTSGLIQEKLLRVIEYGEYERVGGSQTLKTDVRLICATNEDLPTLAEQGAFRADLLDRLAFDVITLPPLRERREDILMLAENFAINMARQLGQPLFSGFTRKAQQLILDYDWPGNIRELKNVVERSVYRHDNPDLPVHQIVLDPFESPWRPQTQVRTTDRQPKAQETQAPVAVAKPAGSSLRFPLDFKNLTQEFEIQVLTEALKANQYNQKRSADALGLTYHQLRGILRKYELLGAEEG